MRIIPRVGAEAGAGAGARAEAEAEAGDVAFLCAVRLMRHAFFFYYCMGVALASMRTKGKRRDGGGDGGGSAVRLCTINHAGRAGGEAFSRIGHQCRGVRG